MPDTGLTLLAFGIPAIAVTLLLASTVLTVRVRGWRRLYWACCAILIAGGSAGAAGALCCLPPTVLPDGSLSGEMPPMFGARLMLAFMGCSGALPGLIFLAGRARIRQRRSRT